MPSTKQKCQCRNANFSALLWSSFAFVLLHVHPASTVVQAFAPSLGPHHQSRSAFGITAVNAANSESQNEEQQLQQQQQRTQIRYCSVSPQGFWVFLDGPSNDVLGDDEKEENSLVWPVQITSNRADATSATSAHALTFVQLVSGVDLAGAVLPPELLAQLTVDYCCHNNNDCENNDNDDPSIQDIVARDQRRQKEEKVWPRRMPTATLDQLTVTLPPEDSEKDAATFALDVAVETVHGQRGRLTVIPSINAVWEGVWHEQADPHLLAFACLSLALRYKAPLVVSFDGEHASSTSDGPTTTTPMGLVAMERIRQQFPHVTPVAALQQTSHRVGHNIERSFRVNQLQAALLKAQEFGDTQAEAKIRAHLDEMDSLEGLPTQAESDTESMQ